MVESYFDCVIWGGGDVKVFEEGAVVGRDLESGKIGTCLLGRLGVGRGRRRRSQCYGAVYERIFPRIDGGIGGWPEMADFLFHGSVFWVTGEDAGSCRHYGLRTGPDLESAVLMGL